MPMGSIDDLNYVGAKQFASILVFFLLVFEPNCITCSGGGS